MSNYANNRISNIVDKYYPKEKQELMECIQSNVTSHSTFNYPNFLETCKIQINQFYFKSLAQHCDRHFKSCIEKSGDSLENVSLIQSMDCSSQHFTPEEIECKNDFLKYFGEFVSENIKVPVTDSQTLVNENSTNL